MSANSQEEFLEAYEKYSDALFRHCYFRVYDREMAKDLVQEIFCKTWSYISAGKEVDNFRAFLYRVAHNVIVDEQRKRRPVSLEVLAEKGFTPKDDSSETAEKLILGKELQDILQSLEEDYRNLIIMRYLDGLTPKEIADSLGLSENVVSVRIHRGIKKLRELHQHEYE